MVDLFRHLPRVPGKAHIATGPSRGQSLFIEFAENVRFFFNNQEATMRAIKQMIFGFMVGVGVLYLAIKWLGGL